MKKKQDFVHLHVHTDASQLDGLGKVKEYVARAAELGMPGIGITDHGTMRQFVQQHEQCEKAGIRPVYGCEFYISPDMHRRGLTEEQRHRVTKDLTKKEHRSAIKEAEEELGIRDRWHITVWAETQEGLSNLYRLTSRSWIDGFYYKPRIDLDALTELGSGLMVATGCLASPIHDMWRAGKKKKAVGFADRLFDVFGDRMWLEVQPHGMAEQIEANKLMVALRKRYGGPKLVGTQDSHYVEQGDAKAHDCLLCIGTNSKIWQRDRFSFPGDQFFFKSRDQMRQSFYDYNPFMRGSLLREALDSTVEIAERCTAKVEIDYKKALLPDAGIPSKYDGDSFAFLRDLCLEGWHWRSIPKRARMYAKASGVSAREAAQLYKERLIFELGLLKKQRFSPYFIMVRDIYREARERGIMVGPGRGSVGGSLIAYLVGITAVDPIEHGLLFERFMNPDRNDMPDIDMDFEDFRREEMIDYMRVKYGQDKVCQISTVGKLNGKQCFRDVCRVIGVPYPLVNSTCPSIIERKPHEEREHDCIEDSFKEHDVLKKLAKDYPLVPQLGPKLEGTAKALGIHAAGVVASPVPLQDVIPLEVRKSGDIKKIVSAVDMNDVAKLGLVKLDFLGLKTLTVVRHCLEAIERRHGVKLDLESPDFDINDKKTLQAFTDGDFVGVFQYDSPSAVRVCKGIEFTTFADVATMTAINRPGTSKSGMDEKFRAVKANPKLLEKHEFHPIVSEITSDTLGCMVYQEHLIKIFQRVGGFTPGEADKMRKVIGKKLGEEEINKHRAKFVSGAEKIGMDEKTADRLFSAMVFFAGYGFNKSHATEYGLIGYWCMWLKVNYPIEFFWALLTVEKDKEKIKSYAAEAKRRGIQVLQPHINASGKTVVIDGEVVRGSLSDISGVGERATADIVEKAPFKDFVDFLERIDRRCCNRGTVVKLAKAGAFGNMVNLKWLDENVEMLWRKVAKLGTATSKRGKQATRAKVKSTDVAEELRALVTFGLKQPNYNAEELGLLSAEVNPVAFGTHPIEAWHPFTNRVLRVHVESMGVKGYHEIFDDRGHWVLAMTKKVKKHQIGDYGDVEPGDPTYGKPYANVNVEDASGVERRIKFHHFVYAVNQEAIDTGIGKPLLVHCTTSAKYESIRAHFAVDVTKLREKLKKEEPLTIWERIAVGEHPARVRSWKTEAIRKERMQNRRFLRSENGGNFTGVVTHVQESRDRNGHRMARFGMIDAVGHYIDVMAFASVWSPKLGKKYIRAGAFIKAEIRKTDDDGKTLYSFAGGNLVVYNRSEL